MSYVRRSGRINPNYNANQNAIPNRPNNPPFSGYSIQQSQSQYQKREVEKPSEQQRYFNNPLLKQEGQQKRENQQNEENQQKQKIQQLQEIQENEEVQVIQQKPQNQEPQENKQKLLEAKPEPISTNLEAPAKPESQVQINEESLETSATTKALNKMEVDGVEKRKWKKGTKIPLSLRRKRFNQKLSKVLAPKSALILLHELKPGCVYKVQEQQGVTPPAFVAHIEFKDVVLGMGQGMSKSQAKNAAAENAIKAIVSKTLTQTDTNNEEGNGEEEMDQDIIKDSPENLPWAGLASYAIYKMFSEWQNQGMELPVAKSFPKMKTNVFKNSVAKKDLPPNASELHPTVLLNMMHPGLTAVEIGRENGPKCKVTMAYTINGQMYTGVGGNKKDAKREAAKTVISNLYGLSYAS